MHEFLDKASVSYYEGYPIISDEEFDLLAEKHNYNTVGYTVTDAVPHAYQMYSLQKCFNLDDAPLDVDKCICTPKLDGAAVSLLYAAGTLVLALTRGDGKQGRDITDKMRWLVPTHISNKSGLIQITGEVVAPKEITNARNYAAGSLGLKDVDEFSARPLAFVAYDATPRLDHAVTYLCVLKTLHRLGFNTVLPQTTPDALQIVTKRLVEEQSFDLSIYPTDGYVYRLNDNEEFLELGHTAHHPRGAFALKEIKEGVVTKLLKVEWQLGKSGVVSPVGVLESVVIDGANVSRATLHNIQYIRDLNLEIGCQVEVIRSGDIIPRVLRRVEK
tara:strand:- start:786 stop:1775 length:990 start_codon:yes stop_codon:yes gene_type:complete